MIRAVPGADGVRLDRSERLVAEFRLRDSNMSEVVDLETGEHRYELKSSGEPLQTGHEDESRLAHSADGSRVATIDRHGVLRVRYVPDGKLVWLKDCYPHELAWTALDRDGNTLACTLVGAGDHTGVVAVWDVDDSRLTAIAHGVAASGERGRARVLHAQRRRHASRARG